MVIKYFILYLILFTGSFDYVRKDLFRYSIDGINIQINREYLNGTWARVEDRRSVYKIKGDSIYYFSDLLKGYYVELNGAELTYHLEGWSVKSQILKLTNDSLILTDDNELKYRLFKKKSFY